MSNKWDKLLTNIIGKRIAVTITKKITGDSWLWYGVIKEYITDEINGGYVIFEHLPTESIRIQTKESYIHLGIYHFGLIDVLNDNYTPEMYTSCPTCNERLKLEELQVSINKESGDEESHIILSLVDMEGIQKEIPKQE